MAPKCLAFTRSKFMVYWIHVHSTKTGANNLSEMGHAAGRPLVAGQDAGFDFSSAILRRLRPPPLPFHGFTQELVDPCLVTTSLALQPRQPIGIHANRHPAS